MKPQNSPIYPDKELKNASPMKCISHENHREPWGYLYPASDWMTKISRKNQWTWERNWWKPKSINQQTYVISKLYLSKAVYLGKRLCSKDCVWARERKRVGEGYLRSLLNIFHSLSNINSIPHPSLFSRFLAPAEYFVALWKDDLCLEGVGTQQYFIKIPCLFTQEKQGSFKWKLKVECDTDG